MASDSACLAQIRHHRVYAADDVNGHPNLARRHPFCLLMGQRPHAPELSKRH